jgi:hypothetical protein
MKFRPDKQPGKREPVYSRPLNFKATKSPFVPPEILADLWKGTVTGKGHVEIHPEYGKIKVLDTCWLWKGKDGADGLGRIGDRLVGWVAWYAANGPTPDNTRFESVCENPLCHNPAHRALVLDPVMGKFITTSCPELSDSVYQFPWKATVSKAKATSLRSIAKNQAVEPTLCQNGHDTSVSGWYTPIAGGKRECRECRKARHTRATVAYKREHGLLPPKE